MKTNVSLELTPDLIERIKQEAAIMNVSFDVAASAFISFMYGFYSGAMCERGEEF